MSGQLCLAAEVDQAMRRAQRNIPSLTQRELLRVFAARIHCQSVRALAASQAYPQFCYYLPRSPKKNIARSTVMTLNIRKMAPLIAATLALVFITSVTAQKQKASHQPGKPVIWADPGAVERLDFASGAGGRMGSPKPPFVFVEESLNGSNPKVRVKDANGATWTAKFGSEVNAETFATRIAWAVGYFVEPAYFVPSGKIEKLGPLERA